jgi:uncharacterized protein YlxP (DUF503 family)
MVVAVATLILVVPEPASLKDKRRILQRLTTRIRARFNVAVAEVGTQDRHDTITLGIACLANDAAFAHKVLEKVVGFVEEERIDAELTDYGIELY